MSRFIKLEQINPEEQLLARLAWACEIEGMTQADAAKRFGVTRLRVNKALGEARRRGILRISVDSVYAAAVELEWELENKFRLARAIVVPSPEDDAFNECHAVFLCTPHGVSMNISKNFFLIVLIMLLQPLMLQFYYFGFYKYFWIHHIHKKKLYNMFYWYQVFFVLKNYYRFDLDCNL